MIQRRKRNFWNIPWNMSTTSRPDIAPKRRANNMQVQRIVGLILGMALGGGSPAAIAETTLFTNAIVHTVTGNTLAPGQVLMENGKIKTVATQIEQQADH